MFIAVTSDGPSLEARIDPRFGRCRYFLIINTDDLTFEAVENGNRTLGGGAGTQSAQMMAEKGVTHLFTGACGPNAYQVLAAAGIAIVTGCGGAVRDVINQFRQGRFTTAGGPNVTNHYGAGQGFRVGRGRARGMNAGFSGQRTTGVQNTQETGEDELETLKRQMDVISDRIHQLEKEKG